MGQWFLQWMATGVGLVASFIIISMLWKTASQAWSSGNWQVATAKTVGPLVSFIFLVAIGGAALQWAFTYSYGMLSGSPVIQSTVSWGTAGAQAISGSFQSYQIAIPEAPSLTEAVVNNLPSLPSEADVRSALGVPSSESAPTEKQEVAPQNNESAPANNWMSAPSGNTEWSPSAIRDMTQGWGATPMIGPQPAKPTQGPAPRPTATPAPVQGPAPQPTSAGWNVGFGGGPTVTGANEAIATVGTYTVQGGDSLSKISQKVYGSKDGWMRICNANRDKLRDCNTLRSGTVLKIP